MRESGGRRGRKPTPAVGDEVRVPTDVRNECRGYEHSSGLEGARESIDGLVVSIREIASGLRVKVAAGDTRAYAFDLLQLRTFDPRVSSKTNTLGVTAGRIYEGATYARVKDALRGLPAKALESSAYETLSQPPFSSILDGWRLVRVCATRVEVNQPDED